MTTTKEKPMAFNSELIPSLLDGSKTQTRRIIKPQPPKEAAIVSYHGFDEKINMGDLKGKVSWFIPCDGDLWPCNREDAIPCPYEIGDRVWVREAWVENNPELNWRDQGATGFSYKADFAGIEDGVSWKSLRFMPRKAARIFLEITGIKAERLQDISEEDAKAEGAPLRNCGVIDMLSGPEPLQSYRTGFVYLWNYLLDNIDGPGSWSLNPWVWVYEFREVK